MGGKLLETLIGAIVLVVAVGFLMFVYSSTQVGTVAGYEIVAKFDRVDGLGVGSDVRVGGIKVGTVTDQFIEPETFLAVVRMSVDPALHMPSDSSAAIVSNGLLGEKYLALTPGAEDDVLGGGGEIRFTQSSVNIESLISQLVFGLAGAAIGGDKQ
jgi:phospholipid/cholesterol/gamma-HCH transport system substrate-binding protein